MLCTSVLKQFAGAYQFKVVKGFAASVFFHHTDASDPKDNRFAGEKGEGKGPAIQVDQAVYRKPGLDFLYVSFRKHYIVVFLKHLSSRSEHNALLPFWTITGERRNLNFCLVETGKIWLFILFSFFAVLTVRP
jgi:hypothetical protein